LQAGERVAPPALIDQVVPLGNQVVDRAAVVRLAERHAAVHAASALIAQMLVGGLREDLAEVGGPFARVAIRHALLRILHESGRLTHAANRPALSGPLGSRTCPSRRAAFARLPRRAACAR